MGRSTAACRRGAGSWNHSSGPARHTRLIASAGVALALAGTLAACGDDERARTTPDAGPRAATVAVPALPSTLDPAKARSLAERAIAAATQTPLLTYRRTAGDEAAALEPALAVDLPSLSDDQREYRFQLRRGLVYADGDLVKASDVERAIAHASAVGADPALRDALAAITGAPSADGKTLSGVRSDDRTGVIVVRLRHPDGRIPLALADPATAPLPSLPRAGQVPASTGPLRIAGRTDDSIQLAANPLRATISTVPAARLAQVTLVPRAEGATTADLRDGRVDLDLVTPSAGSPKVGDGITHVTGPSSSVVSAYVPQRGILAALTVRRALADAVDARGASAVLGIGSSCGLLPAFAVGAVDREPCPAAPVTPQRPRLAGVVVRIAAPDEPWAPQAAQLVRKAVVALGGTVQVQERRDPAAAATDGTADVALVRVSPRLPHPSLWLAVAAELDPLLEREVPRLTRGPLTGTGGRWSALDKRAVDRAVAIPLLALQRVVTTGPQLDRRTVLVHPVLGIDLAALDLA